MKLPDKSFHVVKRLKVSWLGRNGSAANLRQGRKLGEVGLALLQESVLALFAFLSHAVEHGGVVQSPQQSIPGIVETRVGKNLSVNHQG